MPIISGSSLNNMTAGLFTAFSFETLTISNSVRTLTKGKYTQDGFYAKRAFITVETASFRYKYNDENPTTSVGHLARPNSIIILLGTQVIKNFKAIRSGSSNAKISVTYEA